MYLTVSTAIHAPIVNCKCKFYKEIKMTTATTTTATKIEKTSNENIEYRW